MKKEQYTRAIALCLALVFVPLLDLGAAALIDIGIGTYKKSNTFEANAGIEVDSDVEQGSVLGTTTKSESDTSLNTRARATSTNANTNANINSNTSIKAGESIRLIRSEVKEDRDGEASIGASTSASTASDGNADAVADTRDLEAFVSGTLESDENVEEINLTEDEAVVSYKQYGMLFGFFPVTYTVTAHANANGEVVVRYPWYAFVVAKDQERLKNDLEKAVSVVLADKVQAENSQAIYHASEQARVVASMQAVFKRHLEETEEESRKDKGKSSTSTEE